MWGIIGHMQFLGGRAVKNLGLLVWLTQLGLSVAAPPVGFLLLALWLRRSLGWGGWVIWAGVVLGAWGAVSGLRSSLRAMDRMAKPAPEEPPLGFNEHE